MKQKIAITGGIGSGKSIVGKILQEKGFTVYSCDEIYKDVVKTHEYIAQITKTFPSCIANGAIDRKKLALIVFNNPQKLDKLNQITHPLIMEQLNSYIDACKDSIVFAEVPLLFECGYEHTFDKILVVQRIRKNRVAAVVARDALSEQEILARINTQFPYDTQEGQAYIQKIHAHQIFNNNTIESVKLQINDFLATLK